MCVVQFSTLILSAALAGLHSRHAWALREMHVDSKHRCTYLDRATIESECTYAGVADAMVISTKQRARSDGARFKLMR